MARTAALGHQQSTALLAPLPEVAPASARPVERVSMDSPEAAAFFGAL